MERLDGGGTQIGSPNITDIPVPDNNDACGNKQQHDDIAPRGDPDSMLQAQPGPLSRDDALPSLDVQMVRARYRWQSSHKSRYDPEQREVRNPRHACQLIDDPDTQHGKQRCDDQTEAQV